MTGATSGGPGASGGSGGLGGLGGSGGSGTAAAPTDRSVVWSGRSPTGWDGGLDDWNTSPERLHELLEQADRLVVLDPLSFPWRLLTGSERLLPVLAVLPDGLDAGAVGALLGRPLLSWLTPSDTLVVPDVALRDALQDQWQLAHSTWHVPAPREDDTEPWWHRTVVDHLGSEVAADAKAAHLSLSRAIVTAVEQVVETTPEDEIGDLDPPVTDTVVVGVGRAVARLPFLAHRCGVGTLADAGGSPEQTLPTEAAAVLVDLADDCPAQERADALRRAREVAPPGGRVLVSAFVVPSPTGTGANPSVSGLVEEVSHAFATMVTFDDVRSCRLPGEPHSRVVLLTLTSLWPEPS